MVASSIVKAADDVDDAAVDADDWDGAPLPHARVPAMAAVAISPPRNIRPFRALKAVTSLTVGIVLGRGAAVNSFGNTPSSDPDTLSDTYPGLRTGHPRSIGVSGRLSAAKGSVDD